MDYGSAAETSLQKSWMLDFVQGDIFNSIVAVTSLDKLLVRSVQNSLLFWRCSRRMQVSASWPRSCPTRLRSPVFWTIGRLLFWYCECNIRFPCASFRLLFNSHFRMQQSNLRNSWSPPAFTMDSVPLMARGRQGFVRRACYWLLDANEADVMGGWTLFPTPFFGGDGVV